MWSSEFRPTSRKSGFLPFRTTGALRDLIFKRLRIICETLTPISSRSVNSTVGGTDGDLGSGETEKPSAPFFRPPVPAPAPPNPPPETHPHADELIVQYDPGQQVHAAHVDGEQGQRVGGHQYAERVYVQVIGEHPQHAEHAAPGQEVRGREAAVPEVAHALAQYVGGRLVVVAAQLTEEVQREEQHGPVRAEPRGEKRRVVRHQLQQRANARLVVRGATVDFFVVDNFFFFFLEGGEEGSNFFYF